MCVCTELRFGPQFFLSESQIQFSFFDFFYFISLAKNGSKK